MLADKVVIVGYGDVGQRLAAQLLELAYSAKQITAIRRSESTANSSGIESRQLDLDKIMGDLSLLQKACVVYLVPPPAHGFEDTRSRRLIEAMDKQAIRPQKIVLLSTTAVYGDCSGEWVTEEHPTNPKTDRGKRRLDAEQQWLSWSESNSLGLTILRVPGIYARSRLPIERLKNGVPVVRSQECGYTNRIHADDLAAIIIAAMCEANKGSEIFNVADGVPGKVSDYLQAAAASLNLPALAEISLAGAQQQLSQGMLSYLSESRKISNAKMLKQLKVTLRYPDYRIGLRH